MLKKGTAKLLSLLLVIVMVLAACSGGNNNTGENKDPGNNGGNGGNNGGNEQPTQVDPSSFPKQVKNDEAEIEGGTLTVALVSDTPFAGVLDYQLYSGAPDAEVLGYFNESIFGYDANYQITNDVESAAKFELETLEDGKMVMTVTIQDGVKWHNGEPLEAEDYAYSYYIIGHPEYEGVRYGDALIQDIVGMEDYHAGKTDKISGIEVIDSKTVKITWNKFNPSITSGVWAYAAPKDHYGDVPVKDLLKSEKIRTDVVGLGPFKVNNIVPGESVEYVRFDDYYGGKPKLDKIILKVVAPEIVKEALEKGEVDIASFPTDQFDPKYVPTNFQFLADMDNAYTYIGFKLGRWDKEKGEAVQDRDTPLQNVALRKAIGYAMDNKAIGEKFYNGLRIPATTLMIPFFADFHNPDIEGYYYDPEKAKEILKTAGFVDINGDGFVETPEGKEFKLTFMSMSGGETAEPIAQYYIQSWKAVGINVELFEGRLHEFNSFYERVGQYGDDDPLVDLYQGAWSTGTDPDPYGLYSKTAIFNFPRYVNEKNEQLLAKGNSPEAADPTFRKAVYNEWQQLMIDDPPVIPTVYRYYLMAVNNRVKNYTIEAGSELGLEDLAVTKADPVKK